MNTKRVLLSHALAKQHRVQSTSVTQLPWNSHLMSHLNTSAISCGVQPTDSRPAHIDPALLPAIRFTFSRIPASANAYKPAQTYTIHPITDHHPQLFFHLLLKYSVSGKKTKLFFLQSPIILGHHWSGWTETATENGAGQAGSHRYCGSHLSVASSIAPDQNDACFVHLLLQHFHTLDAFKSGEFGGHSWGWINSRVSLSNNAIVERARWTFQVSQCSVETLFRWGGKCLRHFAAILFRKLYTNFIWIAWILSEILQKHILVSLFRTECTMPMAHAHFILEQWSLQRVKICPKVKKTP